MASLTEGSDVEITDDETTAADDDGAVESWKDGATLVVVAGKDVDVDAAIVVTAVDATVPKLKVSPLVDVAVGN